jgi:hypothetical protein
MLLRGKFVIDKGSMEDGLVPRIRCRYSNCIHLDDGFCSTHRIELDPEEGCLSFTPIGANLDDEWIDKTEEIEYWGDDPADEWLDFEDDY